MAHMLTESGGQGFVAHMLPSTLTVMAVKAKRERRGLYLENIMALERQMTLFKWKDADYVNISFCKKVCFSFASFIEASRTQPTGTLLAS